MRTSAQIEAEINRIRARLDNTLGELENRLAPRELIREGVDTLSRYEAGRYVLKAGELVRRYPVPAAIAGAGVIGILFAARQRLGTRYSYSTGSTARLSRALDGAREKLDDTRRVLSRSAGTARDKVAGATAGTMATASEFAGVAGTQLRRAGAGMQSIARSRPVAVSAIALAVGAAIGLGVPAWRRRNH